MGDKAARPGRPRDPRADAAILQAARDLMAEGGLSNLTVEGTAQRAGVAKTTVYRRYPTKLTLAVAAVAALISPEEPYGENLEDVVGNGLAQFTGDFASSDGQSAFLSVAAAASGDGVAHALFTSQVLGPIEEKLQRSLGLAGASASSFAFDVLMGTMIHRLVIRQLPLDDDFEGRFVELTRFVTDGDAP
ncbi:MAG: TetR/AcrR family transcriptional regulator [Actinobacteria bacterium]|nr:TetR/AcrR family transcriptional regulator [Actinomycetota bacterium]MCB8996499.1 TetR/AcrR family transcriptional regulator [Actinomycetota bacterium]MCB9425387.1 TetR/AcrR family transcriptional regulator [Actinomycetota bacterium]